MYDVKRWLRSAGARVMWGGLILATMTISYVGIGAWRSATPLRPTPIADSARTTADSAREPKVNPAAALNGKHLLVFVFTASDCGWSTQPAAMEAIRTLRAKLQAAHGSSYTRVTVVGVAIDEDIDAGLRFLAEVGNGKPSGAFDQIVVGGNLMNEEIVRLMWRARMVKQALLPQIIAVERAVDGNAFTTTSMIDVATDRLVANPSGNRLIENWIREGTPLLAADTARAR